MPTTITSAGVTFTDTTTLTSATLVANSVGTTQITNGSVTAEKLGTNEQKQIAKAWVNFNGTLATPITPRASYNVSSITKNGTGDYTVNFATAMSDANYSVSSIGMFGTSHSSNTGYGSSISLASGYTPSTSSVRIWCSNLMAAGSAIGIVTVADQPYICVQVFGN